MKEQKVISKWLTVAGMKEPKESFPESNKLQLALGLILEELIEAAESGTEKDLEDFLNMATNYIEESRSKLKTINREEGDIMELRDAMADLRVVLGNLIHFSGCNEAFQNDFSDVMESNFSKFCKDRTEAEETVKLYSEGKHPNKMGTIIDTYIDEVDNFFVIKRKSDDKVLKSLNYEEPRFRN